MAKDERFDIVIIGGGPNGMASAAYLAKSGLSVCLLEERLNIVEDHRLVGVLVEPLIDFERGGVSFNPASGLRNVSLHQGGFRETRHG